MFSLVSWVLISIQIKAVSALLQHPMFIFLRWLRNFVSDGTSVWSQPDVLPYK